MPIRRTLSPARWLADYTMSYLERDGRQISQVHDQSAFQRFLSLCAGRTGQLLNLSNLAQDAGPLDVVCLRDDAHVGFMSMVDSIMRQAKLHLTRLNARKRETVPASELVVGVQCGGSDAFSGVTANPAVGFCTDLLVRAGASVMFSEVTEVRDGIDQLTARATTPEVAQAMIREMAWYDAYLKRGGADRSDNTTPGNKKGGLSNIVEKAMGSIIKSGSAPIRRWHDLMDVNAGTIADGSASVEDVGWELFRLMLDVASGRKKTWAEPWKLHNALALFNPASVT